MGMRRDQALPRQRWLRKRVARATLLRGGPLCTGTRRRAPESAVPCVSTCGAWMLPPTRTPTQQRVCLAARKSACPRAAGNALWGDKATSTGAARPWRRWWRLRRAMFPLTGWRGTRCGQCPWSSLTISPNWAASSSGEAAWAWTSPCAWTSLSRERGACAAHGGLRVRPGVDLTPPPRVRCGGVAGRCARSPRPGCARRTQR